MPKPPFTPLSILRATGALFAVLTLPWATPALGQEAVSSTWGADYFPDVPLVTHEGEKVRFFTDLIEERVVMINFIYTSCPDVCPLETARLREVQKILGDRVGRDVFMYSITIDPQTDTVEVLKDYRARFDAGPGWLFLTGRESDIVLLRQKLGVYREEETDLTQHVMSLVIGNQSTGQWMRVSPFENPYFLATQVGSWLHNWKLPPRQKQDYAEAPELRQISKGESLFRTRCASCHTIGKNQEAAARKQIGPDLLGVTEKRDRQWLERWLAEPDKMLAQKDPIALALLAEWDNVPMPNLSLTGVEIDLLLDFIAEQGRRQKPATDHEHHHHGPKSGSLH